MTDVKVVSAGSLPNETPASSTPRQVKHGMLKFE